MLLDKNENKYWNEERLLDLWNLFVDTVMSTDYTGNLTLATWSSKQSPGAHVIHTFTLMLLH